MTKKWERQKGESSKSYSYFTIYRDLGPTRTIPKILQQIEKVQESQEKSQDDEIIIPIPTLVALQKASSRWHWTKRCTSYDYFNEELDRKSKEDAYNQKEERLISLGEDLLEALETNIKNLNWSGHAPTTVGNTLKNVAMGYDYTVKNIRLLYGRSTENKESKVEGNLGIENDSNIRFETNLLDKEFMESELDFMKELIDDKNATNNKPKK